MILGKILIPSIGVNLIEGLIGHYSFDSFVNGSQHADNSSVRPFINYDVDYSIDSGLAGIKDFGIRIADLYNYSGSYPYPIPGDENSMAISIWYKKGVTIEFQSRFKIDVWNGSTSVSITQYAYDGVSANLPYRIDYTFDYQFRTYHHFILNGMTPYINGNAPSSYTIYDDTQENPIYTSRYSEGSLAVIIGDVFNNGLDNLSIWGRTLTSQEISFLFNSGAGRSYLEYASGISNSFYSCTGGTISYSNGFKLHTFTSNGTFTVDSVGSVNNPIYAIIVGGGGGAGKGTTTTTINGGGGGAGQFVMSNNYLSAGNYSVVIGSGGAGATSTSSQASGGQNSSFNGVTAIGGGGGGSALSRNGWPGGSGGGAGVASSNTGSGGNRTRCWESNYMSWGNRGSGSTSGTAGGGGGAGGPASGITGGPGVTIFGLELAKGGNAHSNGTAGTANTGNGANAPAANNGGNGQSGGSGIVIIYYRYE